MSGKHIPAPLRRWLDTLGERCEYCRTSAYITAIRLEADHWIPRTKGGLTDRTNLCRACPACNTFKGDETEAIDPETSTLVTIFHPRLQRWENHFAWSPEGTRILGLTACGRATIEKLRMNNEGIVRARELWVSVGWHPPLD